MYNLYVSVSEIQSVIIIYYVNTVLYCGLEYGVLVFAFTCCSSKDQQNISFLSRASGMFVSLLTLKNKYFLGKHSLFHSKGCRVGAESFIAFFLPLFVR